MKPILDASEMVGKERLLALAEFISQIDHNRIDARYWADWEFRAADCGTSACLGGWATALFPNDLILYQEGNSYTHVSCIRYQNAEGLDALRFFFQLSIEQGYDIFNSSNTTEQAIANLYRISGFQSNLTG